MSEMNDFTNFGLLKNIDQVKFVISDRRIISGQKTSFRNMAYRSVALFSFSAYAPLTTKACRMDLADRVM